MAALKLRDRQLGGRGPAEGATGPAPGGRGRHAPGDGGAGRPAPPAQRSGARPADGGGAGGDAPPPRGAARTGEVTAEPVWLTRDVVLAIHEEQLAEHDGGEGVRD